MTTSLKSSFPITEPIALEDFLVEVGIASNLRSARSMISKGLVSITFEKVNPKVTITVKDNYYLIKPAYTD